jgi:16S rRNA (uracil1498-N3)-methyltransferase
MELYFAHIRDIGEAEILFDEFESKHLIQTMRKSVGDIIEITDGQGLLYKAVITKVRKGVMAAISEKRQIPPPSFRLSLAVGFIRPARLEFIFEKATEIGVSDFHLIRSRHANYFSENVSRYERIIRQAIKQSAQYYLPGIKVHPTMADFITSASSGDLKLTALSPAAIPLLSLLQKLPDKTPSSALLVIGPEGGFSPEEENELRANEFLETSLGKTRLRAETAAICAAATIQFYIQHRKESPNAER